MQGGRSYFVGQLLVLQDLEALGIHKDHIAVKGYGNYLPVVVQLHGLGVVGEDYGVGPLATAAVPHLHISIVGGGEDATVLQAEAYIPHTPLVTMELHQGLLVRFLQVEEGNGGFVTEAPTYQTTALGIQVQAGYCFFTRILRQLFPQQGIPDANLAIAPATGQDLRILVQGHAPHALLVFL